MDKRKIIKSSISLILIGFITKIFSSIAKIVMARNLSSNAMGIYMLVVPLYIFFINIIQLSLPTTIATKIAKDSKNTAKIMVTSSFLALVINLLFMIFIITLAPFIANNILKNPETTLSIISLALLVPLISLGGLIKGYYIGIGKIEITAYSQISEEIARIIFIILFVNLFKNKTDAYLAYGAFLSVCAGEVFSLTHMIISLPNIKNKPMLLFKGFKNKDSYITKDILNTALPLTSGKLISTIAYSLEPVIMTSIMLKLGYSSSYITSEYGIISGYVFPLLLMPGFFAGAFGRVLLQPLTKNIAKHEYNTAKKTIFMITLSSFAIGIFFSCVMTIFPKQIMNLLYGSIDGYEYVRYFALPFALYYIESPLISAMMALNKTKKIMLYDTIVSLIRIISLFILLPTINMKGIAVSTIINSSLLVILFTIEIIIYFRKKDQMTILPHE